MKTSKSLKTAIFSIVIIVITAGILIHFNHNRTRYTEGLVQGNTGGNLYNGGYFCEKDGVIYFANPNDDLALYSISRTGSNIRKISSDSAAYINADDNYIYYTRNNSDSDTAFSFLNIQRNALCRVTPDGKQKEVLDGDPCLYACLSGDYVYYIHYNKEEASTLYRVKIDGTEKTQVSKEPLIAVDAHKQYLYYAGVSSDHNLHRMDTEQQNSITLYEGNFYNPILQDGYVYYMDPDRNYALSKMNMETREITAVTNERADCFNLNGSYLYYQRNSQTSPALCRVKTDGSQAEEICAGNYANINVTGSYIYFTAYDDLNTFYYTPATGKPNVSIFNPDVIED